MIAGTGGQGVVTAARLLCDTFVAHGHDVVSGQLHGMAQRGGSVQSSVMIDCGISPVIAAGRADFVIGFEPVETARAWPFISGHTVVDMNTARIIPFVLSQRLVAKAGDAEYPEVERLADGLRAVTSQLVTFDATRMAAAAGSVKTVNIVMLGCLLGSGSLPRTAADFWSTVTKKMPPRLAAANTKAFFSGVELAQSLQLGEEKS